MKVIPVNTVTGIVTTSENTNYPVTNLLDEHPKKQWKADASDDVAILTITVDGLTNGLALFNIIADSVAIAIEDPNNVTWESGTQWEPGAFIEGSGERLEDGTDHLEDGTDHLEDGGTSEDPNTSWAETDYDAITILFGAEDFSEFKSLWVDFESFTVGAVITVTLRINDTSAKTIAAGVLVTGDVLSSSNPIQGLNEGSEDYGIHHIMSNGSDYYKPLDIVRTFNGALQVERDDDFYDFMGVARRNGMKPLAWRITDLDGFRWVSYARFNNQLPNGSHNLINYSTINFDLIEVV